METTPSNRVSKLFALHLLGVSPGEIPHTCYLAASNGMFLKKCSPLVDAVIPTSNVPHLEAIRPYVSLRITRMPNNLVRMAWSFFKWVFDTYHSEAELFLHYNPTAHAHTLICPVQTVGTSHVRANPQDRLPNHQLIGSLHSHSSDAAYHSSTDIRDEKDFDGLHVVMGHLYGPVISLCASLVMNGYRTLVPPQDFLEGVLLENNDCRHFFPNKHPDGALPNEQRYYLNAEYNQQNIGLPFRIVGERCEFPEQWKNQVTLG